MLQPSIPDLAFRSMGGRACAALRSSSFRPNVRPNRGPLRYSSTSRPQSNRTIPIALLAAVGGAAASYVWLQRSLSADSRLIEAQRFSLDVSKDLQSKYASPEMVNKVIKLLQKQLKDDQVTVNDDELLSHGVSANTYHGE